MFFSPKKLLLHSKKNKILNAWKLIAAFAAIVIICVSIIVWASSYMMANSILEHSRESAKELIKQTSKNIQTVLEQLDDFAMTVSRDNKLATYVLEYDNIEDEEEKKQKLELIDEILNKYCKTREEIDHISIITKNNTHILNGLKQNLLSDLNIFNFDVQAFREGNKKSLWLSTHVSDQNSKLSASEKGKVFSIVKGIYSISTLKSQETIIINIKESYLHDLIADIKFLDESNVFIISGDGKYVMNTQDNNLNGQPVKYSFTNEILDKKNGEDIREIDGKKYLITYNTIEDINGTELKWTVVDITPVSSIIKGIKTEMRNIFFIGILCIVFGLIISTLITRVYDSNLDKRYAEKHSIIMERERLATLGQMIGGIAHNLKTPIMSIAGGLEAISELIDEYDNSIGDEEVTREDHHEIAADILNWVEKIKPYCVYMSDVISAVKGQTANLGDSTTLNFTVGELVKRVKILMSHELKKNKCRLNTIVNVDENTTIKGEINNLVQIMNNLISNSIEAYNGESGEIDLILQKNNNNLEIVVRDYGCGIPEKVKEKLLKSMITTKGKNGTGLGLYISYSTIKGKFGGTIHIDSEEGRGTTITVVIPII
ncbi:sensor histidine kinase [Acetivibrio clariflavus]|uniref:sensor histidine kinase n=1 Tax=Acetivibrio clariflavus TaxID=288965 RepID=UPI000481A6F7|nr:sensor histidine kinase [Acetivibrio clariflavus]